MQSFAEFAAESFRYEVGLSWNLKGTSRAVATFTVSSVTVQVAFEQREMEGPWNVAFDVQRGDASETAHLAFHIFNGVFQAVREFIEVRQPAMVVFATKRDELAGVHEAYLKREQAALQELGYELGQPQRVQPYVEFTLRRIAPPKWKE
jgi:hypothetical protein